MRETLNNLHSRCKFDTDKSQELLSYYEHHIGDYQFTTLKLLELGVKNGGSLRLWSEFFLRGEIWGLDRDYPSPISDLIKQERVKFVSAKQTDIVQLACLPYFNIIIDDCAHIASEAAVSFNALFYDHLKPGGWYFIEDWGTGYWGNWVDGASYVLTKPASNYVPFFTGVRYPSHDYGMVGLVKQLVDHVAARDIGMDSPIAALHIYRGLVAIQKAPLYTPPTT